MSRRFDEIARRKAGLIARCAGERDEISAALSQISLASALRGLASAVSHTLKSHPLMVGGVSGLLTSGYTAPLLRTAGEGLRLWRMARPLWVWWKTKVH
jgi:hypothetical protein